MSGWLQERMPCCSRVYGGREEKALGFGADVCRERASEQAGKQASGQASKQASSDADSDDAAKAVGPAYVLCLDCCVCICAPA